MDQVTYQGLAKLVHPDISALPKNIADDRMKLVNNYKNNQVMLENLAVKWGYYKISRFTKSEKIYYIYSQFHMYDKIRFNIKDKEFFGIYIKTRKMRNEGYKTLYFDFRTDSLMYVKTKTNQAPFDLIDHFTTESTIIRIEDVNKAVMAYRDFENSKKNVIKRNEKFSQFNLKPDMEYHIYSAYKNNLPRIRFRHHLGSIRLAYVLETKKRILIIQYMYDNKKYKHSISIDDVVSRVYVDHYI